MEIFASDTIPALDGQFCDSIATVFGSHVTTFRVGPLLGWEMCPKVLRRRNISELNAEQ